MIILKPSKIQGIGCFTDSPIKKGQDIDAWNEEEDDSRFITLEKAKKENQYCLETYCVKGKDGYWCPLDFRKMSVGWYLNHSETPNVDSSKDCGEYFANRDIELGEELTIAYAKLDDEVDNRPEKIRISRKNRH